MSKLTKFIYASDSHGDMADPEALAALYEFTKDFKPDIKIAAAITTTSAVSVRASAQTRKALSPCKPTSRLARTFSPVGSLPSTSGATTNTASTLCRATVRPSSATTALT